MAIAKDFGNNVLKLRREKNLTQKALAEKANITASALSSYEKGLKSPSLEAAYKIAAALGTSLDFLCSPSNIPPDQAPATYDQLFYLLHEIYQSCNWNISTDYVEDLQETALIMQCSNRVVVEYAQSWIKFIQLLNSHSIEPEDYRTLLQRRIDSYSNRVISKDDDSWF